jgi:hypothetical protein
LYFSLPLVGWTVFGAESSHVGRYFRKRLNGGSRRGVDPQ